MQKKRKEIKRPYYQRPSRAQNPSSKEIDPKEERREGKAGKKKEK
jgi:hypothetical protein